MSVPRPHGPRRIPSRARWALGLTAAAGLAGGLLATGVGGATTTPSSSAPTSPGTSAPAPAPAPKHAHGGGGLIDAASNTSLTITTLVGRTETFALTSATKFRKVGGTIGGTVKSSSLTPGLHVTVRVDRASSPTDPTAVVVVVRLPTVGGRVVSVSGNVGNQTVVVRPLDGLDETLRTSPSTELREPGVATTSPAISVGDVVGAVGQVDSTHSVLNASEVLIRRYG